MSIGYRSSLRVAFMVVGLAASHVQAANEATVCEQRVLAAKLTPDPLQSLNARIEDLQALVPVISRIRPNLTDLATNLQNAPDRPEIRVDRSILQALRSERLTAEDSEGMSREGRINRLLTNELFQLTTNPADRLKPEESELRADLRVFFQDDAKNFYRDLLQGQDAADLRREILSNQAFNGESQVSVQVILLTLLQAPPATVAATLDLEMDVVSVAIQRATVWLQRHRDVAHQARFSLLRHAVRRILESEPQSRALSSAMFRDLSPNQRRIAILHGLLEASEIQISRWIRQPVEQVHVDLLKIWSLVLQSWTDEPPRGLVVDFFAEMQTIYQERRVFEWPNADVMAFLGFRHRLEQLSEEDRTLVLEHLVARKNVSRLARETRRRTETIQSHLDRIFKALRIEPHWVAIRQNRLTFDVAETTVFFDVLRRQYEAAGRPEIESTELSSGEFADAMADSPQSAWRIVSDARFRRLTQAINNLTPERRRALLMREVAQLSYSQIGEALGLRPTTAYFHVSRARHHSGLPPAPEAPTSQPVATRATANDTALLVMVLNARYRAAGSPRLDSPVQVAWARNPLDRDWWILPEELQPMLRAAVEALNDLADRRNELFVLRHVLQRSDTEIAREKGLSPSYVTNTLARAAERLRLTHPAFTAESSRAFIEFLRGQSWPMELDVSSRASFDVRVAFDPSERTALRIPLDEAAKFSLHLHALHIMDSSYRQIFFLSEVRGMTVNEMAELLNTTPRIVQRRLERARVALGLNVRSGGEAEVELFGLLRDQYLAASKPAISGPVRIVERGGPAHSSEWFTLEPADYSRWQPFIDRINSLPIVDRQLLFLRHLAGLSQYEIARHLRISQSTVSLYYLRILQTSGLADFKLAPVRERVAEIPGEQIAEIYRVLRRQNELSGSPAITGEENLRCLGPGAAPSDWILDCREIPAAEDFVQRFRSLPIELRKVLLSFEVSGLTTAEIAERMGWTTRQTYLRLTKAREAIGIPRLAQSTRAG